VGRRGRGGEMTQILYAHMNKIKIKKKRCVIKERAVLLLDFIFI
jgi:hypothetical protein